MDFGRIFAAAHVFLTTVMDIPLFCGRLETCSKNSNSTKTLRILSHLVGVVLIPETRTILPNVKIGKGLFSFIE